MSWSIGLSNTAYPPKAVNSYRWRFNDALAPAGNNRNPWTLTNVQPANAGTYFVVITNIAGGP